ncbi:NmrA family NAD(P)-binding protein [Gluconobacter cerinus]|uniref:NAD-dependent epimerase/dehydratase family protein n=1 Tax=Gluconobacter cerinus TaxID=38307 RepID=UPI003AB34AC5
MKIFLTGASGYIGSFVARYLTDLGHEVCGLLLQSDKEQALQDIGMSSVQESLDDTALLAEEAKAADAVIHAANYDHLALEKTPSESYF